MHIADSEVTEGSLDVRVHGVQSTLCMRQLMHRLLTGEMRLASLVLLEAPALRLLGDAVASKPPLCAQITQTNSHGQRHQMLTDSVRRRNGARIEQFRDSTKI